MALIDGLIDGLIAVMHGLIDCIELIALVLYVCMCVCVYVCVCVSRKP